MLTLHTSHKSEYLVAHLVAVLKSQPLTSAFDREVFLIQSQGMERWLSQELANEFGVWANAEFLFPSKFFNQMAAAIDHSLEAGVYQREKIVWHLESLLRQRQTDPDFQILNQYLGHSKDTAVRRYELAEQIARVFDEYQIMRPDLLEAWRQGQRRTENSAEIWQMKLWQQLRAKLHQQSSQHRGQIWQSAINTLNRAATNQSMSEENPLEQPLPKRISVFGISSMPPVFLEFIHGLAKHCDVHFYLLQPCRDYWGDIPGIKEARLAQYSTQLISPSQQDELSIETTIHNPLLALLGQQGREFHQMLLERGDIWKTIDSAEDFSTDQPTTLMHLQDSILNNDPQKVSVIDDSLKVVSCHSRMREIQVLKDYLLDCLNNNPQLELRDMVVMAPDISKYEPFIAAAFDDPRFNYAIADRSIRSSNEILDSFIELLQTLSSRFEWDRILGLLEQSSIYQTFDLDPEELEWIRTWVSDTHIRWGKNAQHKQSIGLPPLEQNTWDHGLQQMFAGLVERGSGIEIEGSVAKALGALDHFVRNVLFKFSTLFAQPMTLGAWQTAFEELLNQTFSDNSFQHLLQLREMLAQLSDLPQNETYSLEVMIQWLESSVGEQKSSQGFLSGQLTFCSILPMRSIPFKVLCLIGLNENEFPKLDHKPSFDLMAGAQNFRTGDRSNRKDDRYQFLDALLSARDKFYLSYIGQSIQSNREIPPSVVISEVLDCLTLPTQNTVASEASNQTTDNTIIEKHPLQAFSKAYFEGLSTYDPSAAKTAKMFARSQNTPDSTCQQTVWWDWHKTNSALKANQEKVSLNELVSFFKDPQTYFVQKVLDIRFTGVEKQTDSSEAFTLDALENFQINHQILQAMLNNDMEHLEQHLKQSGAWMQGTYGEVTLEQQIAHITPLYQTINNHIQSAGDLQTERFLELTLPATDMPLQGWLPASYEQANVFYRPGKLKPKYLIEFWIYHLCQQKPSIIIGLSKDPTQPIVYRLPALNSTETACYLGDMVATFLQGLQQPSNFWPEAAWAFQSAKTAKPDEPDKAWLSARTELEKLIQGEYAQPERQLLTRGYQTDDFLNENFAEFAANLIVPIQFALQELK